MQKDWLGVMWSNRWRPGTVWKPEAAWFGSNQTFPKRTDLACVGEKYELKTAAATAVQGPVFDDAKEGSKNLQNTFLVLGKIQRLNNDIFRVGVWDCRWVHEMFLVFSFVEAQMLTT